VAEEMPMNQADGLTTVQHPASMRGTQNLVSAALLDLDPDPAFLSVIYSISRYKQKILF
jgi:hypothetical protein